MFNLFETSNKLIAHISSDFKRSLFSQINWELRLIEILGSRGVGKTTLMLQKAKEYFNIDPKSVLYISLDDIYFFRHSIVETADEFNKNGGKYLFIDEVHKYPAKNKGFDWSAEIKNIYDLMPELNIVYSGSSIIGLYKGNGDLSRRKSSYHLNGLSFREFLAFNNIIYFPFLNLNDIITKSTVITNEIIHQLKIIPHFKDYLLYGYYPFYNEAPDQYFQRIRNIINVILNLDIPSITDINHDTIIKIKKMLAAVASTVPYAPNLTQLAQNLNISDLRTLYKYLDFLGNAELIHLLQPNTIGNKIFHKPEKIYLNNSNIIYALMEEKTEIETIRETFFYNQLHYKYPVHFSKTGDFIIDNAYVFEIGGKNKTKKQIKHKEKSFIAADNIEIGAANVIPLWLFGFLY